MPRAGLVRVRMRLAAVNPSDLVTIAGTYSSRTQLPFVPGFEGVGIVDAVGPEVEDLRPGDRVLPIGSAGAWQDANLAAAAWCFHVPGALSDEAAATSYVNPLTALLMLRDRIAVSPGMTIAINAAGSAIGRMLVRLAAAAGAHPIAVVRSARTLPLLAGEPIAQAIVLADDEAPDVLVRRVHDQLGHAHLDAVLDAVGGGAGEALLDAVASGGRFIHYGLLSGRALPPDLPRRRPDVAIELFWLRQWVHAQPRALVADRLREAWQLVEAGVLATKIEARYPLDRAPEALRHALSAGRDGKILLEMGVVGG
ncbi:MAG TPA: zinc-dependent alcohol dehydrogenase family protein [Saliniramus sp.]|nr:zinc-dependent alcohol dehydrogenase family protein [Saliniramus sp.]